MRRLAIDGTCLALVLALATAGSFAPGAYAQERGEEIVGTITRVDDHTLIVQRKGAPEVRVQVTPSTEVQFTDSGDKKLFPNPTRADLRAGMGVRFTYGTGVLGRIAVHYVPAGGSSSSSPSASTSGLGTQKIKARVESVRRDGRELTADVAGRPQTFRAETNDTRNVHRGDLVVLYVEHRGGDRVITRIDSAELLGTITRVDSRGRSVSIDVNGREETFGVDNADLLRNVREGERVRFEVEERSGGKRVLTALARDRN